MRRAILALGCVLLPLIASAQSIDIIPTWSGVATTDPRTPLTLAVQLKNNYADPIRIGVELELPDGWRRFVPDLPQARSNVGYLTTFYRGIRFSDRFVRSGISLPTMASIRPNWRSCVAGPSSRRRPLTSRVSVPSVSGRAFRSAFPSLLHPMPEHWTQSPTAG